MPGIVQFILWGILQCDEFMISFAPSDLVRHVHYCTVYVSESNGYVLAYMLFRTLTVQLFCNFLFYEIHLIISCTVGFISTEY